VLILLCLFGDLATVGADSLAPVRFFVVVDGFVILLCFHVMLICSASLMI
jgi:hypothetical protein